MQLSPVQEKFILHWGEMGVRWGINRTVAQVHALLYLSPEPLNAEQIMQILGVARSNVSTSIRELQQWGVIKTVNQLGDRRDYFQTLADVWEMFQVIMDERKRREIDPTIALLEECVEQAKQDKADEHTKEQLAELHSLFEASAAWYTQIRNLPTKGLKRFFKMGAKLRKLVAA